MRGRVTTVTRQWIGPRSSREGVAPNGIGRRFALHLHYKRWTVLSQELDSTGVFQPTPTYRATSALAVYR